jgi:ubiquinone/menaquinone biosynthesis C-methylase UbiE
MIDAIDTRGSPPALTQAARDLWSWARYVALHEAVRLPLVGAHRLAWLVTRWTALLETPARNRPLERAVRRRYWDLLASDFENARRGVYPSELLFDVPFAAYAGNVPRFLLDAPNIIGRIGAGEHDDLPPHVDLSRYPAYYRRTFHWQTDGYFSRHSAELYDLGVEILFVGTADVLRRQALAEVVRRKPHGKLRLLDVGTGTGRFLRQTARALPDAELCGVDLSPWYVGFARDLLAADDRVLGSTPRARVETANAEALPYPEHSFDVVTSIFMLHELPRRVRRKVLGEMRRVLVPGGLLVLEDAAQRSESLELRPVLEQFSKNLHEPFFDDYQADDLADLLAECGFGAIATAPHFVAKVVSATKSLAREPGVWVH